MSEADASVRKDLGDYLHQAVLDHPDVMAECLSILRMYNLTPADLFFKYEAFLMSRPSGLRAKLSSLSLETLRELRSEIQREQQAKAVAAMAGLPSAASGIQSDQSTKSAVGVRKGKGNMADIGGFLEGLSTPSRPAKPRASYSTIRSSTHPNNESPAGSTFSPSLKGTVATPFQATPAAPAASSYRPEASRPSNGGLLETPLGRGGNGLSVPSSPTSPAGSPTHMTPQLTQPFELRPQPHSLVETLNPHLPDSNQGVPSGSRPRVTLSSTADPKQWNYRYMFEKISQRSEALDDSIDDYAENIKDAYGISELGDPHFVSEESIYTVGRILSPPTDTSKATTSSLFLESSRLLGAGKRIALRFAPPGTLKVRGGAPGVKGFGLFPGCLACLKGRNGGGGAFVVEEVLLPAPSALAQSSASELLDFQHGEKLKGQPISMMTAAGPYTLEDDLAYAPLSALVEVVSRERPDVLLLLGPFVDAQHPSITSGAVTQTPNEIFRDQVSRRLQDVLDTSPGTVIILVPSVRDVVSHHSAFPQSMLDKEALGLPKKVKVLPNPCTFSINEVIVALSSVDILFHLRREELYQKAEEAEPDPELKGAEVKDAMANLLRHVLGQRSFYPIFPPPETTASEVNLDVTHYPLLKMDGPAPDILILPSKLKHFSKIVDSTLVINPAHLARAHTAGTFAKVSIHPVPRPKLENAISDGGELDEFRDHQVWDRARSEIWRI
ncbi:DNA polymerase alpha subunit B [Kwoniella mangroviensis CBS 10435]|uniref:DNA polymerase alpha subunit B n=1 Tax=Kwoniella mangroviensis CBS 10435 TaxID=1331196 RepID=A0A1B9II32_9TREE|nr:DNA polymerase alpha subunit B [Kwoniella mangroviensis CBS 10435]